MQMGRKRVFVVGMLWMAVWNVVCARSVNSTMLFVSRAMVGFGTSAVTPASNGILGAYFVSSKARNIAISIYGCTAPFAFGVSIFLGGLWVETLGWRWVFWMGAMISGALFAMAVFVLPRDTNLPNVHMSSFDWVGALLVTVAVVLFNFAIRYGASVNDINRRPLKRRREGRLPLLDKRTNLKSP